jgi:NADPH-dependent 2,4-dienoyl-CoA reductase/sulfur reductase-like enzyme
LEVTHLDRNAGKMAVIGNGCAGAECIKALRESGYGGEIHLFTASKWPIYNPMLATYYVAGKISFEQLFPYGKGNDFYEKYQVNVHPASPVIALDGEKRVVANQAGFELKYSQCLVASGASPLLPSVKGIDPDRVHLMRTVEDALRLKDALAKRPRRALVIGASLVGIKLVELFHQAGVKVCLVDLAEHVFPQMAHPACARIIEDFLSQSGIKLRLAMDLKRVEDEARGIKACFGRNRSETADLLVFCVGVRPNIAFINLRQVEVDGGVLVDTRMMTSAPGLYAAGDVSQGQNLLSGKPQIIGSWANARYQGRTAGRNMAGLSATFPGNIPHNIAHFMGIDFVSIGETAEYDRIEERFDGQGFRQFFWKDGLLTGANLTGNIEDSGMIKNALVKGLMQKGFGYDHSLPGVSSFLAKLRHKCIGV